MWNLSNQNSITKNKYSRSLPDPGNYWCGHQQPSVFVDFGTLPDLRKTRIGQFEAEKLTVTGEFFLSIISRENILKPKQKKRFIVYLD